MTDLKGLSTEEVHLRFQQYGPNAFEEETPNPVVQFLSKLWAPVPWMLEVIILLEIALEKYVEAWIIAILIVFNAALSFFQESKAKNALNLLKSRLSIFSKVLRDGKWMQVFSENLVPDDIVRIRVGDIVPCDVKILDGHLFIDQSVLTGESLPVEASIDRIVYAGSVVTEGAAFARVIATGKNTYFGKTVEIMQKATAPSNLEKTIFMIVKYLIVFDCALVFGVLLYAVSKHLLLPDVIPFTLLILVASVPVALPATFALATALGAMELVKSGVLVTRLSAIEEAAAMTVLCLDKTGTITQNKLHVVQVRAYSPFTEDDLLQLAAMASEESSQDPIDLAILQRASFPSFERISFTPFDPHKKYSEGVIKRDGKKVRSLKGAPSELLKFATPTPEILNELKDLSHEGARILCVLSGSDDTLQLVGFVALQDLPRDDSLEALNEIRRLGVKILMITGDNVETAIAISQKVGLGTRALAVENIHNKNAEEILKHDIVAGVFPEDKFAIISKLQNQGYICGMTGDGVNDAPALKRAEVGIATANATDVAKASASLVLTNPGIADIVEAIKTSRRIYQRMLTYTLNKIIKTLQISILLAIGLIITNEFIISQLLILLLLFANDFVTMSISTDKVSYSPKPDAWNIKKLMIVGYIFAACILALSFFILYATEHSASFSIPELQTVIFLTLVYTGQAIVYLVRERRHMWDSVPSLPMITSSIGDIVVVSILAIMGILMAPISPFLVFALFVCILSFFVALDFVKIRIFRYFAV